MKRRDFLKKLGLGVSVAAGAGLATAKAKTSGLIAKKKPEPESFVMLGKEAARRGYDTFLDEELIKAAEESFTRLLQEEVMHYYHQQIQRDFSFGNQSQIARELGEWLGREKTQRLMKVWREEYRAKVWKEYVVRTEQETLLEPLWKSYADHGVKYPPTGKTIHFRTMGGLPR